MSISNKLINHLLMIPTTLTLILSTSIGLSCLTFTTFCCQFSFYCGLKFPRNSFLFCCIPSSNLFCSSCCCRRPLSYLIFKGTCCI